MNNDLKIIITVITTLLLMFATSLLLDIDLVVQQLIRKMIVYLAIIIELYFGYMIFKHFKNKN